ncbi:MAG: RnfABCDGE type electron transport complex subunit D [Tepidisphaerales bacterium]
MNDQPAKPATQPEHGATFPSRVRLYLIAMGFPLAAGVVLYGWRAGLSLLVLVLCTCWAGALWRRIGPRGAALSTPHLICMAILLGLMLPPHLLIAPRLGRSLGDWQPWAVVPAGAMLLAAALWLVGHRGLKRIHPLLLTFLALAGLFHHILIPHNVLCRGKMLTGDLADAVPVLSVSEEPWFRQMSADDDHQARWLEATAARRLSDYTSARRSQGEWLSLEALIRGAMPPLEDIVIGGHPSAMGMSSAIAVLVGGLFLVYRRVIPAGVPLLMVLTAYLCFFILPVPVVVTPQGPLWRPLVAPRAHEDIATVITFANYELMATPLLFVAFFLAPLGGICPRRRAARTRYAFLLGAAIAASQIYVSASFGPYLALAIVNLLSPTLESRPGD